MNGVTLKGTPAADFKVHPVKHGRYYVRVIVARSIPHAQSLLKGGELRLRRGQIAKTVSFSPQTTRYWAKNRVIPIREPDGHQFWDDYDRYCVCTVLFVKTKLDINTIAHEATHAALAYTEARGWRRWESTWSDSTEWLAYPVGDIVEGIVKGLDERGLLDG
jgi:hypothetical protein